MSYFEVSIFISYIFAFLIVKYFTENTEEYGYESKSETEQGQASAVGGAKRSRADEVRIRGRND